MGLMDYSAYQCVDTSAPTFAASACANKTVKGYCLGANHIRCCVL